MRRRRQIKRPRIDIVPPVFKGIVIMAATAFLRVPAGFFFKYVDRSDFHGLSSPIYYTGLMLIVMFALDIVAVWATLPARQRGVVLLDRQNRSKQQREGAPAHRHSRFDTPGRMD